MTRAADGRARHRVGGIVAIVALILAWNAAPAAATKGATETMDAGGAERSGEVAGPLKVFILAGQSNMQGHAHVRTMRAMAVDPATAPLFARMRDADGTPRVLDDVRISSIGSSPEERVGPLAVGFGASPEKLGPEYAFGLRMHKALGEPVLIVKTAWGGKSLHTDFRPPGAPPFELDPDARAALERRDRDPDAYVAERREEAGRFYRAMIDHVRAVLADPGRVHPAYDPAQGVELAGFVWFQGWNDMVDSTVYPSRAEPGGYGAYSALMSQFIRDVRTDLDAPDLPFVIGVMGVGGPIESYPPEDRRFAPVHRNFRDAMAAPAGLPEFRGNVVAVETAPFWDAELVRLQAREAELAPQVEAIEARVEAGELAPERGDAAKETLYAETFTPGELLTLRESTSNAAYHYLGSAKILCRIGDAFANRLLELRSEDAR